MKTTNIHTAPMQNILFFGLTTVDIFNFVKSYPGSNGKVRAEEQMVYAGGPAANGSVACSALGKRTTLITGLGKHPLAGLSKNDLAQNGVKLLDWPEHPEQLPVLSSITVDLSNGDRSVIYTNTEKRKQRIILQGDVPSPSNPPSGCYFHPRCPYVMPLCREKAPELIDVDGGHLVSCHLRKPSDI